VQPPHADAVADGPAGVEDPLWVGGGWHPTNVLAIMIISQQQICGIFRSWSTTPSRPKRAATRKVAP
jgi:hypothetical protein